MVSNGAFSDSFGKSQNDFSDVEQDDANLNPAAEYLNANAIFPIPGWKTIQQQIA